MVPALAALAVAAGACGGGSKDVVPRLPGEGSENTGSSAGAGGDDEWSGRSLIPAPPAAAPAPIALPPVERFTLRNGLEVIAVESHTAPTFTAQLAVKSGRQSEPRDKIGLSSFVASMLPKGARGRSAAQIASAMDQAGAQLTANASFEALLVTCQAPAAGQSACLKAMGDMAAAPSFPSAAMSEVREQLQNAARQNRLDPAQLANAQFQSALWGRDHVRGWPLSETSVGAIQRRDLLTWQRAHMSQKNAVLLVVSGRKGSALKSALESSLGSWRGAAPAAASPTPAEPATKGIQIRLVDVPGARQAQIRVGRVGLAHRDPDFHAAMVVNEVLGGPGERSRLGRVMQRTYPGQAAVTTSFDRNLDRGAFVAAGVAPTAQAVAVMRLFMDQMGKLASEGPREDEVRAAAAALAGRYAARLTSTQEIASAMLAAQLHGLDDAYVRDYGVALGRVTAAAARESAARRLDATNLVIVLVSSGQEIEPQLIEAGLRYEKIAAEGAAVARPDAAAPAAVDPAREKEARALIDAALATKGGAGRLSRLRTLTWSGKGTLNLPGGQVPIEVEKKFLAPDKLRLDMVIEAGGSRMSVTTVLDGDKGWARETRPDGINTIDIPAAEIESGKSQIWRDQDLVLLRAREKGARVAPLDDVTIDGVAHHAVQLTSGDGKRTVTLVIEKKKKRLVGLSYSEQGVGAEESFGDYKTVSGLDIAQQRKTKSAQIDMTITVSKIAVNATVDPKVFAKPAVPAKPAAATPGAAKPGAATPGAPASGPAAPAGGPATRPAAAKPAAKPPAGGSAAPPIRPAPAGSAPAPATRPGPAKPGPAPASKPAGGGK